MTTSAELKKEVTDIFKSTWTQRDGQKVPNLEALRLGNDAVTMSATVLYADLVESTALVNDYKDNFAAEVYKAYLISACRIIKDSGGVITAFDGDRVMAIFMGTSRNTSATKAALNINYAVNEIVNPALAAEYPNTSYKVQQVVGIDTSPLFVARTGIWGDNDLVWIGRAANYAAKLCQLRKEGYKTYITKDVYDVLNESSKYGGSPRENMWEERKWNAMNLTIYRSNWQWGI